MNRLHRLGLVLLCAGTLGLAAPGGAAPARRTATRPAGPGSALSAPLPDSVAARIFTGSLAGQAEDITVRQFVRAVGRFGGRPQETTPQQRQQFLDLLIDQRVLVRRVARERRSWSHEDSLDLEAVRDRGMLSAALDSAFARERRARAVRGDSALEIRDLAMVVRDSTIGRLHARYDTSGLQLVAALFDTMPKDDANLPTLERLRLAGRVPQVSPRDTGWVLLETSRGRVTIGDLLRDYAELNPTYRKPLVTPSQVHDAIGNTLYQQLLREAAVQMHYDQLPQVLAELHDRAEYHDVANFVNRQVVARIAQDTTTLHRHYQLHLRAWDIDETADVLSTVFDLRATADSVCRSLTLPYAAESLATRSERARVPYLRHLSRSADSVLYRRIEHAGVGAVLGPDSTFQGWRALKVMALHPRRHRSFGEAFAMVQQDWTDREAERRTRVLLDELRSHAVIVVNDRALGLRPRPKPKPSP